MRKIIVKNIVLTSLLIRSVVVDANILTGEELTNIYHSSFPGAKIILIEHCPLEEITSTVMHCEVLDENDVGDSLLRIQEVEGHPVEFDIDLTSSDTAYL